MPRPRKPAENEGEEECYQLLEEHFLIRQPSLVSGVPQPDIVAERPPSDFIGVIYKEEIDLPTLLRAVEDFVQYKSDLMLERLPGPPQFWLVGRELRPMRHLEKEEIELEGFRVFTLESLRRELRKLPKVRGPSRIARTVAANKAPLMIACDSLGLLLDEKLAALRDQRPNSAAGISKRDDEIADLVRLRGDLRKLKNAVSQGKKAVDASVISFRDGVQLWWNKHHEKICSRGFDIAMFLSAITVCSLAGVGGNVAVLISGALVGGKSVVDAIKAVGKGFWK
jgi:hypothetical protein